jgi:hypothetical protein
MADINYPTSREGGEQRDGASTAYTNDNGSTNARDQLVTSTKELSSSVTQSAEALIKSEVGKRAGKGARDLDEVANAIRQATGALRDNSAAPYVGKAADQITRVSGFLRTASTQNVVRDVESFARREPLLFLGGAFVLGIFGARLMKSSAQRAGTAGAGGRQSYERSNGGPRASS